MSNLHNLSTNFNQNQSNLQKVLQNLCDSVSSAENRNRIQYHLLKKWMGGIKAQEDTNIRCIYQIWSIIEM